MKTTNTTQNASGYDLAALRAFENRIFKGGNADRRTFNRYYKHVRDYADAKTFFISEFSRFDVIVWCDSLYYTMSQAFPEIPAATINEWIEENRRPHHIIRNKA